MLRQFYHPHRLLYVLNPITTNLLKELKHNVRKPAVGDSDQPAVSLTLIRIFDGHILDSQKMQCFFMQTTKSDETALMRRLI